MTSTNIIGAILNTEFVQFGWDFLLVMASKSKGRMCVVAGCSKRQSDGVSVHVFPKDERQRAAWVRFVKLTRADWSGPSQYTVICSDHFNDDCYEVRFSYMKDFGIPVNKCLIKGSVPSIYICTQSERGINWTRHFSILLSIWTHLYGKPMPSALKTW